MMSLASTSRPGMRRAPRREMKVSLPQDRMKPVEKGGRPAARVGEGRRGGGSRSGGGGGHGGGVDHPAQGQALEEVGPAGDKGGEEGEGVAVHGGPHLHHNGVEVGGDEEPGEAPEVPEGLVQPGGEEGGGGGG